MRSSALFLAFAAFVFAAPGHATIAKISMIQKAGTPSAQIGRDRAQCYAAAVDRSALYEKVSVYVACMRARGYSLSDRGLVYVSFSDGRRVRAPGHDWYINATTLPVSSYYPISDPPRPGRE